MLHINELFESGIFADPLKFSHFHEDNFNGIAHELILLGVC